MTSKSDLLWLLNLRLKIVRFINQTFLSLSENTQHELLEEVKVYLCYGRLALHFSMYVRQNYHGCGNMWKRRMLTS